MTLLSKSISCGVRTNSSPTGMDTMIEKMKETFSADMVEETGRQIRSNKETLGELQIQKGVLLERLENIDTMRGEISMLNNGIAVAAGRADCYEALKQAFSQDGVPHQIIRNIIPHITDTTNNILGQMTGGTMGVEFVMERTVKGKDGDKATLDVLINEYGKTTLPYASKSGGEKVKASLAVILALSEIKATAAGIQLGMLFIDEPPFLDDEGAQAYVDALETIRDRYSDVKIMAITHDDAMKARFGQAVTVIKTDDGIFSSVYNLFGITCSTRSQPFPISSHRALLCSRMVPDGNSCTDISNSVDTFIIFICARLLSGI